MLGESRAMSEKDRTMHSARQKTKGDVSMMKKQLTNALNSLAMCLLFVVAAGIGRAATTAPPIDGASSQNSQLTHQQRRLG